MKRQVGKAFSWAPPTLSEYHTIGQMARWSNQKSESEEGDEEEGNEEEGNEEEGDVEEGNEEEETIN